MAGRLITLRYRGRCSICSQVLEPGDRAFHDRSARTVTCTTCAASSDAAQPPPPPLSPAPPSPPAQASHLPPPPPAPTPSRVADDPPTPTWDVGEPGRGVLAEYERRRAKRRERLDQKWGRIAPVVRALTPEPQHIQAFRKGADGERRLAARLEKEIGDRAIVLHSRRTRSGDIDHLAIAPSGIYVIDAKRYEGRVQVRDVGGWFRTDRRLYVRGRDKSALVAGSKKQAELVRRAIEPTEHADTQVHAVLCFIEAEWDLFAKPIELDGVVALWPKRLVELLARPGDLQRAQQERLAAVLSAAFPPIS